MLRHITTVSVLVLLSQSFAQDHTIEDISIKVVDERNSVVPEDLYTSGGRSNTVTTHTTAGDEVKSAFGRAIAGFFLFIFGFPVLWFNEAREAKMWVLFGRARSIMKEAPDKSIAAENEACLVHVSGTSKTDDIIKADNFPVSVSNCTKLSTTVEMYQWQENSTTEEKDDNMGGKEKKTTYTYVQVWSSTYIDSSSFNDTSYVNPVMKYEGGEKQASLVSLGDFNLTKRLIDKTCKTTNVSPDEIGDMSGFNKTATGYSTLEPNQQPEIGSVRVNFKKVPCGPTSVLAVQHNNSFAPLTYTMKVEGGKVVSPDGNLVSLLDKADDPDVEVDADRFVEAGCCGKICCCCSFIGNVIESREEVYELAECTKSSGAMLDEAAKAEGCIHSVLKLVGFLMLVGGLDMMFTFFPTLFRFIPFAGVWIQWILNGAAHIASFLLGGFFWCVTVALAWLAYRPVKAIIFLSIAIALVLVGNHMANQP